MKRKVILSVVALAVCALSVFSFTACNFKISGEGKLEVSVDDKDDCVELLNGFFEESLGDPNFVVTVKEGETVLFTESVLGDKSCADYPASGDTPAYKIYAFKQDGVMYGAYESDTEKTYATGENSYKSCYCMFKHLLDFIEEIPVEGSTFNATNVYEDKDLITKDTQTTESSATLTFDIVSSERTFKIVAIAKNNMVQKVTLTLKTTDGNGSQTTKVRTASFVYGSATVNIPNMEGWSVQSANQ